MLSVGSGYALKSMNLTQGTNYYIIFFRAARESVIRRSYSAFALPLPVKILILTNPSTQWHPLPPPSVFRFFFLLLFTVNMGAAGVCMGKEKREQNERSSCSASLSDRAKNTPPLRALSLPSSRPLLRSFSLPLSTRSFLLAFSGSPLHTLTSLAVQSTPSVPRMHQTVALWL